MTSSLLCNKWCLYFRDFIPSLVSLTCSETRCSQALLGGGWKVLDKRKRSWHCLTALYLLTQSAGLLYKVLIKSPSLETPRMVTQCGSLPYFNQGVGIDRFSFGSSSSLVPTLSQVGPGSQGTMYFGSSHFNTV